MGVALKKTRIFRFLALKNQEILPVSDCFNGYSPGSPTFCKDKLKDV